MDRSALLADLAMVEGHVAQGERHIAEQTARIAEMEERGQETATAR